eukprot:CAMPEP_0174852552 /NCGR_PEP_ID=MMETSP1114-20130205/25841_1 /TAXON_ID=312471 /ORGANISM="Neobodo designis, Strain CCAP 1951/1" /LENGTH=59 /DNA_ID=CAMNT_0016087157 /DNA_START=35 /DNA_END=211 /DNA_ORIENTATION=+
MAHSSWDTAPYGRRSPSVSPGARWLEPDRCFGGDESPLREIAVPSQSRRWAPAVIPVGG